MKTIILLFASLFVISSSFAQFKRNEILLGGSLDIASIREKNYLYAPGGGPLGGTSAKETFYSFRPELNYMVAKNTGISIFGEIISDKYSNDPAVYYIKTKGHTLGLAVTEYRFFTKGFGVLARLQGSSSSSWDRTYDTANTQNPKNKFKVAEVSLQPGLFYRFTKHFYLQGLIGKISYLRATSGTEGVLDKKKHYQFNAGFTSISFGVFYIFSKK